MAKKKKKKKKGQSGEEDGVPRSGKVKVQKRVDESDVVRALFWLVILCILGVINNC